MKIVFATANATTFHAGMPVAITIGQHWPADDPIVKAYPSLFADDPRYGLTYSVPPPAQGAEQATAAPGETRPDPRPADTDDDAQALRDHLEKLGVKADGRWSLTRLRDEVAKAEASAT